MGPQHFPKPNEGPDDLHAGLNRDWRVEDARQRDCLVLGKGVGESGGEPDMMRYDSDILDIVFTGCSL